MLKLGVINFKDRILRYQSPAVLNSVYAIEFGEGNISSFLYMYNVLQILGQIVWFYSNKLDGTSLLERRAGASIPPETLETSFVINSATDTSPGDPTN